MSDLSIADLEAAMAAAKAFVDALASGDEDFARMLCYGPSLANWDLSNGVVGLWRQGPFAPFYGRASPTQTARILDGVGEGDPSVACFGFVVASEDDETKPVVLIEGPRPAIAICMIQSAASAWQVWGEPLDEWRSARLVAIPLS